MYETKAAACCVHSWHQLVAYIVGIIVSQGPALAAGPVIGNSNTPAVINDPAVVIQQRTGIRQRIARSQAQFNDFARNFPEKETTVMASFTRPMEIEEVVASARALRLSIAGFLHGSATHSGGYTLQPGELVENAIAQYRRDAAFFTDEDIRINDEVVTSVTDKEVQNALRERRVDLLARKQELDRVGLKILGVEVRGKGADLSKFQSANTFVRVLEIQDGARKNAAIPPQE